MQISGCSWPNCSVWSPARSSIDPRRYLQKWLGHKTQTHRSRFLSFLNNAQDVFTVFWTRIGWKWINCRLILRLYCTLLCLIMTSLVAYSTRVVFLPVYIVLELYKPRSALTNYRLCPDRWCYLLGLAPEPLVIVHCNFHFSQLVVSRKGYDSNLFKLLCRCACFAVRTLQLWRSFGITSLTNKAWLNRYWQNTWTFNWAPRMHPKQRRSSLNSGWLFCGSCDLMTLKHQPNDPNNPNDPNDQKCLTNFNH